MVGALSDRAMPELKLLFLQMTVILVTARLMAVAVRYVGQPEVVGEMIAGILLGPSLLGRISAATMNSLFPATSLGPLYALSQLGLVLFMFLVGLDVQPDAARGRRSPSSSPVMPVSRHLFCAAEFWPGNSIRTWEAARPVCHSCCFWERP